MSGEFSRTIGNYSGDRDGWNQKITNQGGDFLQSWQWGEFQRAIGQQVWRLDAGGVSVQVLQYSLPWGQNYLYGPHISIRYQESSIKRVVEEVLAVLQGLAKKHGSIFLRVDFLVEQATAIATDLQQALREAKFRPAPSNYYFSAVSQSPFVAHLDVGQLPDKVLASLRYNTRRSLRLAQEAGVAVKTSDDIQQFFALLKNMSLRKGFGAHPQGHYFKLQQAFGDDLVLLLVHKGGCHCECPEYAEGCVAISGSALSQDSRLPRCSSEVGNKNFCSLRARNDKLLSGAMMLFYGEQATYLHAASLPNKENLGAPYMILWQAILEAKKRGCKVLDLGAIAPADELSHPWQSITTFKMGWRPKPVNYLSAYDWVNKKLWYKLYCGAKNFKF